jgi:hypothetical protein
MMTDDSRTVAGGGGRSKQPYVCVHASQVAVCIGANKYKPIHEAVDMMWHRIARASYTDAMRRNGLKTETQNMVDIMSKNEDVKKLVDESAALPCESSDQVAQNYDSVSRRLDTSVHDLSPEEKQLVEDVLKRTLYTNYGNAHELGVIELLHNMAGIKCRQDDTFHKQPAGVCNGVPWYIGGKIDAISEDGETVIEIKNRVNHLFNNVPFYEVVQVQTYLQLLGLHRGVLVECLKSSRQPRLLGTSTLVHSDKGRDGGGVYMNCIQITRDDALWSMQIMPKLTGFIDFLLSLIGDEALQDRYLTCKHRTAFVMSHVEARVPHTPQAPLTVHTQDSMRCALRSPPGNTFVLPDSCRNNIVGNPTTFNLRT